MTTTESKSWETARIEYESALEQYRNLTRLRRQDMAFVTTVQAAVLTIIGTRLLSLDSTSLLLSLIAFFVLLLGINSERRLAAYMTGYMRRANQIETDFGMSLLTAGKQEVSKKRALFSNSVIFPLYYFIFTLAWIAVWITNLY